MRSPKALSNNLTTFVCKTGGMTTIQIIAAYLPVLVLAGCVPVLFRRAGYGKAQLWIAGLPLIVCVFSLLAALVHEPGFGHGVYGLWFVAAAILALALKRWPGKTPSD